jgi:hypothetical protein
MIQHKNGHFQMHILYHSPKVKNLVGVIHIVLLRFKHASGIFGKLHESSSVLKVPGL